MKTKKITKNQIAGTMKLLYEISKIEIKKKRPMQSSPRRVKRPRLVQKEISKAKQLVKKTKSEKDLVYKSENNKDK